VEEWDGILFVEDRDDDRHVNVVKIRRVCHFVSRVISDQRRQCYTDTP